MSEIIQSSFDDFPELKSILNESFDEKRLNRYFERITESIDLIGPDNLLAFCIFLIQNFIKINWTGPPEETSPIGVLGLVSDVNPTWDDVSSDMIWTDSLEWLSIGGEQIYEGIKGVPHLALTAFIANLSCIDETKDSWLWRGRIAFVWQRCLETGSYTPLNQLIKPAIDYHLKSLINLNLLPKDFSIKDNPSSDSALKEMGTFYDITDDSVTDDKWNPNSNWILKSGSVNTETATKYLLEFSVRCGYFHRYRASRICFNEACLRYGIKFELTGVLGIRRRCQELPMSQMVVKAHKTHDSHSSPQDTMPTSVLLTDFDDTNDVLENVFLTSPIAGEKYLIEHPLSALETALLLTQACCLNKSSPEDDDSMKENLRPMAERCLRLLPDKLSCDWLLYSAALWFRCRTEFTRPKTVDRACLQLQSLVDQYHDETPSGSGRIKYFYQVEYPSTWEMKRNLASHMMKIGSVLSACKMFEALHLWEDAAECLIVAGRRSEAIEMMESRLKEGKVTPRLLCSLGDVKEDLHLHYRAWEMSKHKYARAQRSIGHLKFRQGNISEAIEHFETSLKLNPLKIEIWFKKGCGELQLNDLKKAAESFGRLVSLDCDVGDAWANLASSHFQLGNIREAQISIKEAVKRHGDSWKMWRNFLQINMRARDANQIITGLSSLMRINWGPEIPVDAFEALGDIIIHKLPAPYKKEYDWDKLKEKAVSFLRKAVSHEKSCHPKVFKLLARFLETDELIEEALYFTIKECRQIQVII
eukprot:GHVL01019472.1.p1 GENE.GHVL01019472.1~~GHVL01019472.1.p1  ORF type:complete len:759 (-),score=124.97 GHVL01019472.1:954-3230(-)